MRPHTHCQESWELAPEKTHYLEIYWVPSYKMALNFSSHDLLLQPNHQVHSSLTNHQNGDTINSEIKPQLTNSLDLDSGSLMHSAQAAANMNMWKNSMSLGHSFLPTADMGSFTASWPTAHHGGHNHTLGHQSASHQSAMTHHILENQHLMYSQHHDSSHHQRSMSHLAAAAASNSQELVGAMTKTQAEQATSFMLNSINHQVNASSNNSSMPQIVQHHPTNNTPTTSTSNDNNLNIRTTTQSTMADHQNGLASYNLALNDNQFYNSNRNDSSKSQVTSQKPSTAFLTDRSMPMSLSNHQHPHHNHQATQIANYHSALTDQANHLQAAAAAAATSSHHIVNGPGTSNGNSSRNTGNFRCSHCGEMFTVRGLYQSHLKTHSHEKGKLHILSIMMLDAGMC